MFGKPVESLGEAEQDFFLAFYALEFYRHAQRSHMAYCKCNRVDGLYNMVRCIWQLTEYQRTLSPLMTMQQFGQYVASMHYTEYLVETSLY